MDIKYTKIKEIAPDGTKKKTVPGLDVWLSTASDYEKRVVHNFVSRLSEANRSTEEMRRPHSLPAGQITLTGDRVMKPEHQNTKNKKKNLRLEAPTVLKSVSTLPVQKHQRPSSSDMKVVPNLPKEQIRTQSHFCVSAGLERSKYNGVERKNNQKAPIIEEKKPAVQAPADNSRKGPEQGRDNNELLKIPLTTTGKRSHLTQRPRSTLISLSHNCNNCEACKKKKLKEIVEKMSGGELRLLSGFLENKCDMKEKMATDAGKPRAVEYGVRDDDYFHHGSAFQPVKTRDKGYFTIHPQFVSESIVELKKKRDKY